MFAGTISHAGALITAIVVLNGTAILRGGEAAADPNQDDQFLALLHQKEIPALTNVPSLIATAHKVCRKLDGGMPVNDVVDAMMDNALNVDATAGQTPSTASHAPSPDSSLRRWRPTARTFNLR
ncbi:hypothetical protein SRL2020226_59410 [Mycobacterium kiyosense]|jgi:hypothetical protein|uniref:DUF732 domain-containing protein n=1 Tax=Mycobacterium kiyosense TaxID=2871094 RepID=A0AA37UZQ3_9MYCO|nr:hypothetical protein SRL2020028_58370 [Mycobacterium kiyosense]GLB99165.1 hypothetical protein SRL2020226_59410 [Mycobacterium kiyosense]